MLDTIKSSVFFFFEEVIKSQSLGSVCGKRGEGRKRGRKRGEREEEGMIGRQVPARH
jgi:hypothetical protein